MNCVDLTSQAAHDEDEEEGWMKDLVFERVDAKTLHFCCKRAVTGQWDPCSKLCEDNYHVQEILVVWGPSRE
jgi:hypothetical protein